MIDTGQKFLSAQSAFMTLTLRSRSQTKNLNVEVFVKVFKTSLFPNLIIDFLSKFLGPHLTSKPNDGYNLYLVS